MVGHIAEGFVVVVAVADFAAVENIAGAEPAADAAGLADPVASGRKSYCWPTRAGA